MRNKESALFWDIISCPCHHICRRIIAIQNGNPCWQIPEPWNGYLSERFLIVGGNPAIDLKELYPSTLGLNGLSWAYMGTSSKSWTNADVETFFEKRFGHPVCNVFGRLQPYVDTNGPQILQADGTYKRTKNDYWGIYNKICTAIDSSFVPWHFAVTDIVHCKSSSSQGLTSATFKACVNHTKKIVDLFVQQSQSESPVVILVGADANRFVDSLFVGSHTTSIIGGYSHTRKGNVQNRDIVMREYSLNGIIVRVVCGVPAPSKANGQMSNIVINGQKIW